jgi:hypothetical protein
MIDICPIASFDTCEDGAASGSGSCGGGWSGCRVVGHSGRRIHDGSCAGG